MTVIISLYKKKTRMDHEGYQLRKLIDNVWRNLKVNWLSEIRFQIENNTIAIYYDKRKPKPRNQGDRDNCTNTDHTEIQNQLITTIIIIKLVQIALEILCRQVQQSNNISSKLKKKSNQ